MLGFRCFLLEPAKRNTPLFFWGWAVHNTGRLLCFHSGGSKLRERARALTSLEALKGARERASERRGAGLCVGRRPMAAGLGFGVTLPLGSSSPLVSLSAGDTIHLQAGQERQLPLGHLMSPKAPNWLALSPSTPFRSEPQAASRGSPHRLSSQHFPLIFSEAPYLSLYSHEERNADIPGSKICSCGGVMIANIYGRLGAVGPRFPSLI